MIREKEYLQKSSSSGFTLLEAAIASVLGAVIIMTGTPMIKSWLAESITSANQQRMSAIQQALNNYVTQHGRLPCPATFLSGGPNYGHEISIPCAVGAGTFAATGRAGPIIPSPNGTATSNPALIIGALPVADLGLPKSYSADSYKNMYTYAVPLYETDVQKYSPTGAIEVVDQFSNDVTPPPPSGATKGTATYVVVDHGPDGKGAYQISGVLNALACNGKAGLDNDNCNHYASGHFRTAVYDQRPGANWFDDMIIYGVGYIASNSTTSPPSPPVCTTQISGLSGAGGSQGHYKSGFDTGGFIAVSSIGGIFFFWNTLTVNIAFGPFSTASPTADAYCPDNTYNAMSGGCTQTSGGAPYGGGVYISPIDVPAPYFDYMHDIFFHPKLFQVVPPPMSHPAAGVGPGGGPGWECNGSSAAGMQVQAYVVCCPNGS